MTKSRKIFVVVAAGGHDTDIHYRDTIKRKRNVDETAQFLNPKEVGLLKESVHNMPYIVWGAVPGKNNIMNWQRMEPGDYIMVYRSGKIIMAAEVAFKVHNKDLAKFFWTEDNQGNTWEYIYLMINDIEVNVNQVDFNKYAGYPENYSPRGFMAIEQTKADKLLSVYGDLISLLQKLERGEELEKVNIEKKKVFNEVIEEKVKKAHTEHDEMQWRLIRLGGKAHFDIWVPRNDRGKNYQGNLFKNFTLPDFHETMDVPISIKNIDVVWRMGLSVKSAFEIEHSTSIYSGILRLSDLRALAPNSNYPLFIVADRDRKNKVFDQLERPTFSNDYLQLDKIIKFLSYDKIRELDNNLKEGNVGFDIKWLSEQAEGVK